MAIAITCPGCKSRMNIPDAAAGMQARCPKCGQIMTVPPPAAPAATPPPQPSAFKVVSLPFALMAVVVGVFVLFVLGAASTRSSDRSGKSESGARSEWKDAGTKDGAARDGGEKPPRPDQPPETAAPSPDQAVRQGD